MISKSNLSFFKTVLTVLIISAFVYACKKEHATENSQEDNQPNVSLAKKWYQSNFPKSNNQSKVHDATGSIAVFDFSQIIQPNFDKSKEYERYDDVVLEIPADSARLKLGLNAESVNVYKPENGKSSFLILNNGSGYIAYVMTVIADAAYLNGDLTKLDKNTYRKHDDNFSGVVLYSTPKGEFVNAWIYKNGIVTEDFSPGRTIRIG